MSSSVSSARVKRNACNEFDSSIAIDCLFKFAPIAFMHRTTCSCLSAMRAVVFPDFLPRLNPRLPLRVGAFYDADLFGCIYISAFNDVYS